MRFQRLLYASACLIAYSAIANAEIVSKDAIFEEINPPPSVLIHELESSTHIRIFKERSNHVTDVPFQINGTGPRTFEGFGDYRNQLLPVGTTFDSYFVHFDSLGTSSETLGPGDITFSTPIIGIVGRDPHLIQTSVLVGAPGTLYPTIGNGQHFDFGGNDDAFTLLPDGHSIRIQSQVGPQQDQLRILVASIPEPTAACQLGLGTLAALLFYRRKRNPSSPMACA